MSDNWKDLLPLPKLAVVGSRLATAYGRAVTTQLVGELARAGVVIVSGLAYGIDAIAHRAALDAGGLTMAVLAGGLDEIYPEAHHGLARQVLAQGGALISEYEEGTPSYKQHFIERNRLVSGLSRAVLITEATDKSGTMHTANFALDQGRDVLVVPGNITSPQSVGTNRLLKAGALPVTSAADILRLFGLSTKSPRQRRVRGANALEQAIIDALAKGETDGQSLLEQTGIEIAQFNQALTMLEITGKVRSLGANQWALL